MKSGGLVPDELILRLITNEFHTRGWLRPANPADNVMTLASSAITSHSATAEHSRTAADEADAFISSPSHARGFLRPQINDDPSASFLLDGFPRTRNQAERLDEIVPINLAVWLKTPLEVILERISGRWVHEPSGRVYNDSFNPPKVPGRDDVTGDPLVKRADDSEEVYRARWAKFLETSEPLLEHYAKKGVLWEVEGMSSDEITPKLFAEFERRFAE